jgi:hypothetical protein
MSARHVASFAAAPPPWSNRSEAETRDARGRHGGREELVAGVGRGQETNEARTGPGDPVLRRDRHQPCRCRHHCACDAVVDRPAGGLIQNGPRRLRPIKGLQWQTLVRGDIGRQRLFRLLANPRGLRDLPGRIANAAPGGNIYSPFCCFRAMVYFTILVSPIRALSLRRRRIGVLLVSGPEPLGPFREALGDLCLLICGVQ